MYSKVLVANRGEVAVRIIRACKEMGIQTVAIYSEADAESLHTYLADECYCIGGPLLEESYLNQDAILMVAKKTFVDAIHPGYGLLSENAEFAKRCVENQIAWIGPSYEVMMRMSQKEAARRLSQEAGVPVTCGSELLHDVETAIREADRIGYPVLLKASAGGGGKGIRLVRSKEEMQHAYATASEEAIKAFGDGGLYLEKYLEHVKHIEAQIIADIAGNIVVLGDRDCSIQRKNQKLVEECPAPTLPDEVRKRIYDAAKRLVKACHYTTVGTIEFLVDEDGHFYFMEMNTRLQVEHSVTEMVCNIDIVQWQIRTAAGYQLLFHEEQLEKNGHAIECRICAEEPIHFTPSCGFIDLLHIPGGPNIRFDSAIYQNYTVLPFYDSMLGKLIVCARSREEAIRKMKSALAEFVLTGIQCNRDFYLQLLEQKEFIQGTYTTGLLRGQNEI